MPYRISGVVEATWTPPSEHAAETLWHPVLCLDAFNLDDDGVSAYLFGLSQVPSRQTKFAARGLPNDSTRLVDLLAWDSDKNPAGTEGAAFGHTYASMSEIEWVLSRVNAPKLADSSWRPLMSTIKHIQSLHSDMDEEQWRLIVWAHLPPTRYSPK